MTGSEPWEDLVAAEKRYISVRMAMFAGDFDNQISMALRSPRGRGMALRVLRDVPLEYVERHIAEIFSVAVSTHGDVALARDVIARLDPDVARAKLGSLVKKRIEADDAIWEDYRRTADLLAFLRQDVLLESVLTQARKSTDPDTLEVAEDYDSPTRK